VLSVWRTPARWSSGRLARRTSMGVLMMGGWMVWRWSRCGLDLVPSKPIVRTRLWAMSQ
jgi:hypothetical protein